MNESLGPTGNIMDLIQSIFVVFLFFSALSILGLNLTALMVGRRRDRRGYFVWGIVSCVLALIPTFLAMILGWAGDPQTDPNNFLPFVYFMNLFFVPAALLSALIGIYEPAEDTVEPRH
jgi:amino acid transporter